MFGRGAQTCASMFKLLATDPLSRARRARLTTSSRTRSRPPRERSELFPGRRCLDGTAAPDGLSAGQVALARKDARRERTMCLYYSRPTRSRKRAAAA